MIVAQLCLWIVPHFIVCTSPNDGTNVELARLHDRAEITAQSNTKESTMEIAVIGAGNVGGTLGKRWAKAGHEVAFGARDPADAKVSALVRESGPSARAASVPEAVRQAAVGVLTVRWDNAREALAARGGRGG